MSILDDNLDDAIEELRERLEEKLSFNGELNDKKALKLSRRLDKLIAIDQWRQFHKKRGQLTLAASDKVKRK